MKAALLLARKDLRMLARTRLLVVLLVLYPIAMAGIVGGVLINQGPPTIALVNEDNSGETIQIGDKEFSLETYIQRAERAGVEIVNLDRDEAEQALDDGQVAGVLIIPQGTVAQLQTQLSGADLTFLTGDNPLGSVVAQRMRGVVYGINLSISNALIESNRSYLETLVEGGEVDVNGSTYDLYGLAPIEGDLQEARDALAAEGADDELLMRLDRAIEFAGDAGTAIGLADNALEATAAPVRIDVERANGRSPLLTAQALSFALAVSIAFVCVVLIAASLAAERDEGVMGRMLRGLARAWQVVLGKLVLGALLAVLISLGLFAVYALLAPQAWERLGLLLIGVTVASCACSGIGALIAVLARDARTATLVAILLILPLAPLTLIGLDGWAATAEQLLPLAPARDMFNAILFENNPRDAVVEGGINLLLIATVTATLATWKLRRLA